MALYCVALFISVMAVYKSACCGSVAGWGSSNVMFNPGGARSQIINTRKQKILIFKIHFPINIDRDQSEKSLVHINKSLYDLRVVKACIFLMNRRSP